MKQLEMLYEGKAKQVFRTDPVMPISQTRIFSSLTRHQVLP